MSTPRHANRRSQRLFIITTSLTLLAWAAPSAIAQDAGSHDSHQHADPKQTPAGELKSDPYPLDVCPVSGGKLGTMGDPVVKTIDGREVRFCCAACIDRFEADKATYWQKIDKEIVKEQMPFYPLAVCPISGEELGGEMGEPVDYVFNNRLVRFCCKSCVSKFLKDPKPMLAKLDEAVIAQQKAHYPMTTCMVSGETLGGEMGEPVERVYNNHLLRLCCKGCIKDFEKNPARFLGMLDGAWRKQGGLPKAAHTGGRHDDHGRTKHEDHEGHGDRQGDHGGDHGGGSSRSLLTHGSRP